MPAQASKSRPTDLLPDLQRRHPSIDFDHLQALVNADFSTYEIADKLGISQPMAWRLTKEINNLNQQLTQFKDNKLDFFAGLQLKSIRFQEMLIDYFQQDSSFRELKPKEKIMLFDALNRTTGTLEDKQITIVNIKGNLNINSINLSPEESTLLQSRALDLASQHLNIPSHAIEIEAQASDATEIDPV